MLFILTQSITNVTVGVVLHHVAQEQGHVYIPSAERPMTWAPALMFRVEAEEMAAAYDCAKLDWPVRPGCAAVVHQSAPLCIPGLCAAVMHGRCS